MAYCEGYDNPYAGPVARGHDAPPPHAQQYAPRTPRDNYQHSYGYSGRSGQDYGQKYHGHGQARALPPPNDYPASGPPGRPPLGARGARGAGSELRSGAPFGRYPTNVAYAAGGPPMGSVQPGRRDAAYDTDHDLDGQMAGMSLARQQAVYHLESRSTLEGYYGQDDYGRLPINNSGQGHQQKDNAPNGYADSRNGPLTRQAPNGYADYGEEYTSGSNGGSSTGFGPPARSVTMPVHQSGARHGAPPPQRTETMPSRHNVAQAGMPQRPSTATGNRQAPRRRYPPSAQGYGSGSGSENHAAAGRGYGLEPTASSDEVFNTYFDDAQLRRSSFSQVDAVSPAHKRGGSFEQHRPGAYQTPRLLHAKSEANLREPQSAVFEMAADIPTVPRIPHIKPYQPEVTENHGRPRIYEPMGAPVASSNSHRPGTYSGSEGLSRTGSAASRTTNPDALPSHPTPVRPGLMANSVVNLGERPPPVRNYGAVPQAGPPAHQPLPSQQQRPVMRVGHNPAPKPAQTDAQLTAQELERLRMVIKNNTNDQDSALSLARKLIEAADVLAPKMPDAKQRVRTRERYLVDAQKILKKLANAQNQDAIFVMADGLGRGLFGHQPDSKEAFTLYQSAAKLGHAAAAYRTAVCCEIGHDEGGGTRKDLLKAMQWYKRAATLGDPPAMYKVGMILLKGLLGQQRNPREAVSWLKRAAERADAENPHALHELGLLYESAQPNDAITRDEGYALSLFQQAAELGYRFSQYRLGCTFEYGLMGCPIDPRQSIYWYSKAAAQEEHQSELAFSGWYLTGSEGVLGQNDTEAYLWARKAAAAGLAKAEYAMGYFTEVGIGIPANLEDAKRWYWRAAGKLFQDSLVSIRWTRD